MVPSSCDHDELSIRTCCTVVMYLANGLSLHVLPECTEEGVNVCTGIVGCNLYEESVAQVHIKVELTRNVTQLEV